MAKTLPKNTKYRRRLLAVGLSLLWAVVISIGQLAGAFQDFDQPLLDWRQSLPSEVPLGEQDLALVQIDELPVNRPWPWPRLDYAILLRSLLPYNPEAVVFDILLHDRDTKVSAFDSQFASMVRSMDNVVFAAAGLTQEPEGEQPRPGNLEKIPAQGVNPDDMAQFHSLLWPLDTFASGTLENGTPIRVGLNNLLPSSNLQPRRVPLVFWVNGEIVPSVALQAAAVRLNASLGLSQVVLGDAIYLRDANGVNIRTVPIDEEGRLLMRYRPSYPSPWIASFDNVPLYARIAETGGEPEQNLREVKGRLLFVGRTDEVKYEAIPGVLPPSSNVEIQMLATRNILNSDYIVPLSGWLILPVYLLVAAAAGLFFFYYGPIPGLVLLGILCWSWEEAAVVAFRAYSVDMPMVSFAVLLLGLIPISFAAAHWGMRPVTRPPRPKYRATDDADDKLIFSQNPAQPAYAMAVPRTEEEQLGMFSEEAGAASGPAPGQHTTLPLEGLEPGPGGAVVTTAPATQVEEEEDVEEPDPDDFEKALARLAEIHEHIAQEEKEEEERQERLRREKEVRAAREALEEERRKREAERRAREAKRKASHDQAKVKKEKLELDKKKSQALEFEKDLKSEQGKKPVSPSEAGDPLRGKTDGQPESKAKDSGEKEPEKKTAKTEAKDGKKPADAGKADQAEKTKAKEPEGTDGKKSESEKTASTGKAEDTKPEPKDNQKADSGDKEAKQDKGKEPEGKSGDKQEPEAKKESEPKPEAESKDDKKPDEKAKDEGGKPAESEAKTDAKDSGKKSPPPVPESAKPKSVDALPIKPQSTKSTPFDGPSKPVSIKDDKKDQDKKKD